ncbi:hypothetical protein ACLX1H_008891 [Fusarium chlamydosporum]
MWNRQSWESMPGQQLLNLATAASAVAISYEGISQGVMGAVTVSPEFGRRMGYMDDNEQVVKPMLQGVVLQASAVSLTHMLCARFVAGMGVAFILVVVPMWTAELSAASHRGKQIAITFLANFSGISLAAWVGFGTSFTEVGNGQFRWRFEFAIQIIPVIALGILSLLIVESPRWLIKAGRRDEALKIIAKLRGDGDLQHPDVQKEYREIVAVVEEESHCAKTNYVKMFLGIGSGDIHLGRRIQLAFWLQVLMHAMLAYIPLVYCFLPETAGRTLEEVDYLFASKSPFTWDEEKEFAKRTALLHERLNQEVKSNIGMQDKS